MASVRGCRGLVECLVVAAAVLALAGCGRGLEGSYRAEVRLVEGKEESGEPGYSLAEVEARLAEAPRMLVLRDDGRFEWRSGDTLNEGDWRAKGDTLILRDDVSNGVRVLPALQKDRRWRIGEGG